MTGFTSATQDIVQEAFVRVLSNLNRFDTRFRFSTWLFTIAKRLFVNSVQKHQPKYDSEIVDQHRAVDASPVGRVAETEIAGNASAAIEVALAGRTCAG